MAYLLHDAAGRLVKEGNKSYTYAWLDKLVSVTEAGKVSANFDYHPDGQIASVTYADGRRENYLWDGLALIHRNGTDILNEPAITGGNPVLSGDKVLFNDLLGNTLGVKDQSSYQPIRMTAFGESDNADAFFTGKPLVGELGYTFLFRNYRPDQGKWQTADPLGYPDGWNNLAYVNNVVIDRIDFLGAWGADVHTAINTALAGNEGEIEWNGKTIDTIGELDDGSDSVDSLFNQAFGDEFEHGMRASGQTVAQAKAAWTKFINDCVNEARELSDKGREDNDSGDIKNALELLGKAVHALADSYAPPHAGFQEWDPPYWVAVPIPGVYDFWDYVSDHTSLETFADYTGMRSTVDKAIIDKFRADFLYIIQE